MLNLFSFFVLSILAAFLMNEKHGKISEQKKIEFFSDNKKNFGEKKFWISDWNGLDKFQSLFFGVFRFYEWMNEWKNTSDRLVIAYIFFKPA